jgi:hypothetical protein
VFDSDGNVSSWDGTCFAEQATSKGVQSNFESSLRSGRPDNEKQSLIALNDELMTAKLGVDKDYTWFNVSDGMFTTLWFGISRTNLIILNKDKSEEIGNYNRKDFKVVASTSQL